MSRRDFVGGAGVGAAALVGTNALSGLDVHARPAAAPAIPTRWDLEADVVVLGAGACGLPAAIRAADHGASVIVVEANYDIGGHGIINGGQVPLGGGTSAQKKYGIVDSPDILFKDLTDWSVVETNGMPEYRFNDRGVQRALADNEAPAYEFLLENGVTFADRAPGVQGGHAIGISAPRENYAIWEKGQSAESPRGGGGTVVYRALENSAKKKGVRFLLNYHMDVLFRETPSSGRVLGIQATYTPRFLPGSTTPMRPFRSDGVIAMTAKTVNVRARKAVIVATGGSSTNVNFRRMFDPRLTEEYQVAGEPWSHQNADGEMAAMAIGAALWGTSSVASEAGRTITKTRHIGVRYGYVNLRWSPRSPMFTRAGGSGLTVQSYRDLICVNQFGKRFGNEVDETYAYLNACLGRHDDLGKDGHANGGGPIWAVFDAGAEPRLRLGSGCLAELVVVRHPGHELESEPRGDGVGAVPEEARGPVGVASLARVVLRFTACAGTDLEHFGGGDAFGVREIGGRHQRAPERNREEYAEHAAGHADQKGFPEGKARPPSDDHEPGQNEDYRRECARGRRHGLDDVVLEDGRVPHARENRHRDDGGRNRGREGEPDLQSEIDVGSGEDRGDQRAEHQAA